MVDEIGNAMSMFPCQATLNFPIWGIGLECNESDHNEINLCEVLVIRSIGGLPGDVWQLVKLTIFNLSFDGSRIDGRSGIIQDQL